ncbi:MAG: SirB2 family protein [Dechloromonas sp.]|nr:SirB2 family protein [Dechloromonas sp.]
MSYLALKHVHLSCVVLSGLGFLWRGLWMWRASPQLQGPLARRLPHLIDSVLLGSAVALAVLSGQYPFAVDWLSAKFFGLLLYIVLGSLALKRGRTMSVRRASFGLALATYGYIVAVALSRSPTLGL